MTTQTFELMEIDEVIDLSHDPDPKQRAEAVRVMCPCQLKMDIPRVWDRLIEMAQDENVNVRSNVFHVLADGSPRYREPQIVSVIEQMHNDPDPKLRRRARKLLAHYRHGGRLNAL
jgi:HEAT repeat protein